MHVLDPKHCEGLSLSIHTWFWMWVNKELLTGWRTSSERISMELIDLVLSIIVISITNISTQWPIVQHTAFAAAITAYADKTQRSFSTDSFVNINNIRRVKNEVGCHSYMWLPKLSSSLGNNSSSPPSLSSFCFDFFRFNLTDNVRLAFFSLGKMSKPSPGNAAASPGLPGAGLTGEVRDVSLLDTVAVPSLTESECLAPLPSLSGDLTLNKFFTFKVLDLLMLDGKRRQTTERLLKLRGEVTD